MTLHVSDFGAAGDGRDDTVAIQRAIDEAAASGQRLHFGPQMYRTSAELVVNAPVQLVGEGLGAKQSTICALTGFRSVLHAEARVDIDSMTLDGSGLTEHVAHCAGTALSVWQSVLFRHSRGDAIAIRHAKDDGSYANNGAMTLRECSAGPCGRVWCDPSLAGHLQLPHPWQCTALPMSASGTGGFADLTITGIDLTTLSLRAGDVIGVGWDATRKRWQWQALVWEVRGDSTILALGMPGGAAGPCAIMRGDGWNESRSGDNARPSITGGHWRSCAGHAFGFMGMYGAHCSDNVIDYCAAGGVRVGAHGAFGVLSPRFDSQYFESLGGPKYCLGSGLNVAIDVPLDRGDPSPDVWYPSGPHAVCGVYRGEGGLHKLGVNGTVNRIPAP